MKNKLLTKRFLNTLLVITTLGLLLSMFTGCTTTQKVVSDRDYYQLKIYQLSSQGQMDQVDNYLKTAYIPALHRAGIPQVGVFKPRQQESETSMQIWVWVPFKSLDQFKGLDFILAKDGQYQSDGDAYINAAPDKAPYDRIESILLLAFSAQPHFGTFSYDNPVKDRIYELRSYESPTEKKHVNKVDMFNNGEVQTFNAIGSNPLFFGQVISGPCMPNLMYMTTYKDSASHAVQWNKFRTHPDWLAMKDLPEYADNVSKNTKYYLYPTEYSDI